MSFNWEDVSDFNGLNNLIGFKPSKFMISEDKDYLQFISEDSTLKPILTTVSDCCSDTWIEHVTIDHWNLDTITKIQECSMEALIGTKQEEDMVYATKFYSEKGCFLQIEYRNSSNGYYGGSLVLYKNQIILNKMEVLERGF